MPKKNKQQVRQARFERLWQLAEQNTTAGLSEAEAVGLVEQVREEVYQIKRRKLPNPQ